MDNELSVTPFVLECNEIPFNVPVLAAFVSKVSDLKLIFINCGQNSHQIVKHENVGNVNMKIQ
jgi:hypothetical protein